MSVNDDLIRCLKLEFQVKELRAEVERLKSANELLTFELAEVEQTNQQLAMDMIRESGLQRRTRAAT